MIIIPELGLFSLVIAFCMACLLATLPLLGLSTSKTTYASFAKPLLWGQAAFVVLGFLTLMLCFVQNNFTVEYVALNSNTHLPLIYKLCAVWGAHEGSLLLWAMILSVWMVGASIVSSLQTSRDQEWSLAILGAVSAGFLFLLLHTSNPFIRLLPLSPAEGVDLNPLLQDAGMIIHPPFLYMGYVGFAIPFAFSISALIQNDRDGAWVKLARPFALLAWAFLTVGIVLGSGWAYYELGWGGWWFWDPVENASLMPWLLGTALCHALLISSERKRYFAYSHLLAIGTFILSLMGTFLVRSGLISSVHAFSTDPKRGSFILAFIFIVMISSFGLYVCRFVKPKASQDAEIVSRVSFMLLGNVVLVVMTFSVLLGTLYPLAMEVIAHKRMSVGPPYFSAIMAPLIVILLLIMSITPYIHWDQDSLSSLGKRLKTPLSIFALFAIVFSLGASHLLGLPLYAIGGVVLGFWLLLATLYKQMSKANSPRRWGMVLAHSGLGMFIIGVTLVNTLEMECETQLAVGQSVELKAKEFVFNDIQAHQGSNFEGRKGLFIIKQKGKEIGRLSPEKRYFPARDIVMTETAIKPGFFQDYYIALGEQFEDGSWSVRIYIKPFVRWIWIGGLLIGMGAAFSGWVLLRHVRKFYAN